MMAPSHANPNAATTAAKSAVDVTTFTNSRDHDTKKKLSPFSVPNTSPILAVPTAISTEGSPFPNWEFPSSGSGCHSMDLPSKELLQSLYEQAMSNGSNEQTSKGDNNGGDGDALVATPWTQAHLARYGILSFEDVFLPAASYQHNQELRRLQAIAQRDHPDMTYQIKAVRQSLYQTTALARQAAQAARQGRYRKVLLDQKEAEEKAIRDLAQKRLDCQREFKKKYPPNQEMWREVAYLVTELQKLEKEERIWKQAEKELESQQQRQDESNQSKSEDDMDIASDDEDEEKKDEETLERKMKSMGEDKNYCEEVLETVQDIQLACTRIQQSLNVLDQAMERSQSLQRQVAQVHDQSRFGGYSTRGNGHQTKDLIRIMSQDDSVTMMQ